MSRTLRAAPTRGAALPTYSTRIVRSHALYARAQRQRSLYLMLTQPPTRTWAALQARSRRFSEGEFFHGREVATTAVRLLAITGKPRARGKKPEPAQTENKKKPKSKKGV